MQLPGADLGIDRISSLHELTKQLLVGCYFKGFQSGSQGMQKMIEITLIDYIFFVFLIPGGDLNYAAASCLFEDFALVLS